MVATSPGGWLVYCQGRGGTPFSGFRGELILPFNFSARRNISAFPPRNPAGFGDRSTARTISHVRGTQKLPSRVVPKLFREEAGAREEKGQNARLSSFVGAMAIADLVKTTLGPKGMDKILQSTSDPKKVTVTNDGATILKSIQPENAAAKILIGQANDPFGLNMHDECISRSHNTKLCSHTSKTQDTVVGDGTTSVAVLAGELLREAERLVDKKIHPQTILTGMDLFISILYTL
eukprot:1382375-Amorphochlora_amoeboformis.AAC.1